MLVGQQPPLVGLADHLVEELLADLVLQQALAVLGERGGSKLGSIRSMSRNQRNSRLYSSSSQKARSDRTEYSAISSDAFSSRSGGIDGRPPSAYISSNTGDRSASASSASRLIARSGWPTGTRALQIDERQHRHLRILPPAHPRHLPERCFDRTDHTAAPVVGTANFSSLLVSTSAISAMDEVGQRQRLEAEVVDDQQVGGEVALEPLVGRAVSAAGVEVAQELVGGGVEDLEALAGGLVGDGLGEVGLADAGLAADQDVAALADEGAGGEVEDLLAVDARVEAEVEQLKGLGGIDRATADTEVEPFVLAALGLVLDQSGQELTYDQCSAIACWVRTSSVSRMPERRRRRRWGAS